jgi:hypothetical protein
MILLIFLRLQPLRSDSLLLFRYFIYQSLARICLISFFLGILSIHLVWIILLVKLILPPFHVWFLMRMKFADRKTFFWVIIIMKFPVFLILIILMVFFLEEYGKILILMFWRSLISLVLLWSSRNLIFFLISSSFLHTLWRVLRLLVRKNIFFCYYFLYSFVLFSLIAGLYGRFDFIVTNEWRWDIYFSLFIFSRVPPSFMFLMKWRLLFRLIELNFILFLLALVVSGVSLYLYFRLIAVMMLRGRERLQIYKKNKIANLMFLNLIGLVLWVVVFQLSLKLKYY